MKNTLRIQNASGQEINGVEDWFEFAPPARGASQWVDGRSAKEEAKAWFRHGIAAVPKEILDIMETQRSTKNFIGILAIPEKKTNLDTFGGNTRNNDVVVHGQAAGGPTVMAIEAKADEPFANEEIGEYFDAKQGTASKVPHRIELLCQALFGRPLDEEIRKLRYQLLHGLAAPLIAAQDQNTKQAVFLVHEFLAAKLNRKNVEKNHRDLERFTQILLGKKNFALSIGTLIGPVLVPGGKFVPANVPVFIGKVSVQLPL